MLPAADAVICQLELPLDTVARAASLATGMFCVNLAPAANIDPGILDRADLVVVNEGEAAFYGEALSRTRGLVATTFGPRGARLAQNGKTVAEAAPPKVTAVDATGAGDCFVGALVVALLEKAPPDVALRFACAAGACAATKPGAQPSLPTRAEVEALL